MKFRQFVNSSTSYPIVTISIPLAPWSGAVCILFVIVGQLVDEFENCPNFIDTFFQKISSPSSSGPSRTFRHQLPTAGWLQRPCPEWTAPCQKALPIWQLHGPLPVLDWDPHQNRRNYIQDTTCEKLKRNKIFNALKIARIARIVELDFNHFWTKPVF